MIHQLCWSASRWIAWWLTSNCIPTERFCEVFDLARRDRLAHVLFTQAPEPNYPAPYVGLVTRGRRAPYRFSLQAGLWNVHFLQSQLRSHEGPWEFERWGSVRSRRCREKLYATAKTNFKARRVFDYPMTGGLVKGKWQREIMEPLCRREGLKIDFSVRGFNDNQLRTARSKPLWRRIWNVWQSLRP